MAAAVVVPLGIKESREPEFSLGDSLTCVIETGMYPESKGLIAGYNYHLLREFAKDNEKELEILLSDAPGLLDSLETGAIDILVSPLCDSLTKNDGVLASDAIDSICCWVVDRRYKSDMRTINRWLDDWMDNEDNDSVRKRFLHTYNPYRRRSGASYICPYDDIIKHAADSIGWDWRLLAAVIYQESHFRIDARSHRGALGLMQLMPYTAEYITAEDMIDPQKSIAAGAGYLKRLSNCYRDTADEVENYKFTLAAYNAGTGRIRDCLNYANHKGVDTSRWENIVEIIPDMREEGMFKGVETIDYVNTIMSLYDEFRRICP